MPEASTNDQTRDLSPWAGAAVNPDAIVAARNDFVRQAESFPLAELKDLEPPLVSMPGPAKP